MIESVNMKSIILTVAMLVASATVWAVDFVKDGLEYTVNSDGTTVSVGLSVKSSTGSCVIPSTVVNGSRTYTVTAIAVQGFKESSVSSVTIPPTVTSIGEEAFYSASNLQSIVIPKSVNYIGKNAYRWCNNATSITFESGSALTELGEGIFNTCSSVKMLDIPEGVKTISSYALQSMSSLSVLILPSTLTKIENYAMGNCPWLSYIKIQSAKLLGVNEEVFYEYSNSEFQFSQCAIFVPEKDLAFYQSNYVWRRFGTISANGFDFFRQANLTYATIGSDEAMPIDCDQNSTNVDIPGTVNYNGSRYNVTTLGPCLFLDNRSLTAVKLPSSIKTIGCGSFKECWGLKALELPDGLVTIGDQAFKGSGIESMKIPNTVTSIGRDCFGVALKELTLSKSLTVIPEKMAVWTRLTSIKIPEGVVSIERQAFSSSRLLTRITLPSTLERIAEEVFENDDSFTAVTCKAVNPPAVADGELFPDKVYQQATLTVPTGSAQTYRAAAPWSSFRNIVEAEFGDENMIETVGLRFYIIDDNSVKVIGITDSSSAVSIPSVINSNGSFLTVTEIAENAFAGSQLRSVEMPETITKVCSGAFEGLSLNTVRIHAPQPPVCADDAFSATTYSDARLYVGVQSKGAYSAAAGWKKFRNIEEMAVDAGSFTLGDIVYTIIEDEFVEASLSEQALRDPAITSITVPEQVSHGGMTYTVIRIADGGFRGLGCPGAGNHSADCRGTVTVTLPESIDELGKEAFRGAHILAMNIPSNLSLIGESCFEDCLMSGKAVIPETVSEIPAYAFKGCHLSEIQIPASISNIGVDAFASTGYLAKVEVEDLEFFLNLAYDSANSNPLCDGSRAGGARLYFEGNLVTEIDFRDYAMTTLGDYALYGCKSISKITFPENFTEIGYMAVTGCSNIHTVECKNRKGIAGPDAAAGFDPVVCEKANLYVPEGCRSAYMSQAVWQPFRNVTEAGAGTEGVAADADAVTVSGGDILNPCGITVRVYDVAGSLVYEGNDTVITLAAGCYIAAAGEKAIKICIN